MKPTTTTAATTTITTPMVSGSQNDGIELVGILSPQITTPSYNAVTAPNKREEPPSELLNESCD